MTFDTIRKKQIPNQFLQIESQEIERKPKKKSYLFNKARVITFLFCFALCLGLGFSYFNYKPLEEQVSFNPSEKIEKYAENKITENQSVKAATTSRQSATFNKSNYYIEIPKLNVIGNVLSSSTMSEAEKLLDKGIVQLPAIESSGQIYTAHSSSYKSGYYSKIFSTLNKLKNEDVILIHKNSQTEVYKVYKIEVIAPVLEEIDIANEKGKVVLLTCWPIGTSEKRLAVYAKKV